MKGAAFIVIAFAALCGCEKVPLTSINAQYQVADVVWFEAEQTLFVFYRVEADQGIEPVSVMELSYRTEEEALDWTVLQSITPIHTHLAIDCGPRARCGSWSLKMAHEPR